MALPNQPRPSAPQSDDTGFESSPEPEDTAQRLSPDGTPDEEHQPDPQLEEEKSSLKDRILALAQERSLLRKQIAEEREQHTSADLERLIVQALTDAGARNLVALQRLSKSLGLFKVHNAEQGPELVGFLCGEDRPVCDVTDHLREIAPELFSTGKAAGSKAPAAPLDPLQKMRMALKSIK